MFSAVRCPHNPILLPNPENDWESKAVFNGSVIKKDGLFHLFYRAMDFGGLSTIGQATSKDGIHFEDRKQFIRPKYSWEKFGCEDPRVTKLDDQYFVFYTALSDFPPTPKGIKLGVAVSNDLQKVDEKHQATYFNSKAMALFPEKISGQMVALLTVNTDRPPAKICLAFFDQRKQIWSRDYWRSWYATLNDFVLPLQRSTNDHVEGGAAPVKTKHGWLVIYSYIRNYFLSPKIFGIEAVLLDLESPLKIIGRTSAPLLFPWEEYELYGQVPNVVFPSGAIVEDGQLLIYYGGADTTCCLATIELESLIEEMTR